MAAPRRSRRAQRRRCQQRRRRLGDERQHLAAAVRTPPTSNVVNLLTIEGEDQVHLKVTVAEVQRNTVKQLGIDWNVDRQRRQFRFAALVTGNPVRIAGQGARRQTSVDRRWFGNAGSSQRRPATLQALEQTGIFRTLAEPTLTAISGEPATFLAGGEFPVPVGASSTATSRSSSSPSACRLPSRRSSCPKAASACGSRPRFRNFRRRARSSSPASSIPSLKVRRAETTLELPSGGSMVMGGLLQDNVKQSISGLPGLKKLPILGALFRSRDFQRKETELVIIVTPYLVKPVGRTALARPDDGFSHRRAISTRPSSAGSTASMAVQGSWRRPAPIRALRLHLSNERGRQQWSLTS